LYHRCDRAIKGGMESLEPREYAGMFEAESQHWWFRGTRSIVIDLLARNLPASNSGKKLRFLDLGCGTGITLTRIRDAFGVEPVGLDIEVQALEFCRQRGHTELVEGSIVSTPFEDDSFDVVTALDVVEHLDDDVAAIREGGRVVRPGGIVLLTVPACPWLWSDHDIALHHKRRYRERQLRERIEQAGLTVESSGHFNTVLFVPAATVRLARRAASLLRSGAGEFPHSDVSLPPSLINTVLRRLLESERDIAARGMLPFGLSLFAVARKKEG